MLIEYGFIATFINVNMLRYGFTLWMRIQITTLTIHIYKKFGYIILIYRVAYSEQNSTVGHIFMCSCDTKQVLRVCLFCYDSQ